MQSASPCQTETAHHCVSDSGSGSGSDSGSDSDKWDSDTLSSDDESEDEADSGLTGRARWVKKVVSKEKLEAMKLKEEGRHNGTIPKKSGHRIFVSLC